MGTISDKLTYLNTTKSQLKDMINYGLDDDNKITSSTTFRNYVTSIFKAFLESLNNPSTLFNNLPKITGTGSNITLNDTANAPMRIMLNATDITQDGTPTPDSPQDIHTISGDNTIKVEGKNLFDSANANVLNAYLTGYQIVSYALNQTIYIPIEPNKTYTINKTIGSGNLSIAYTTSTPTAGGTTLGTIDANAKTYTTTAPSNALYLCVLIKRDADSSFTLDQILSGLMLNEGNTATSYEPYVSQTAEVNLGYENMLNIADRSGTSGGITYVIRNGVITFNGTATGSGSLYIDIKKTFTENAYFSKETEGTSTGINNPMSWTRDGTTKYTYNSQFQSGDYLNTYYFTWASGAVADNYVVKPMLEKGTTAHNFTEYGKAIEYSKMPNTNYKDQFIRTSGLNLFDSANANVLNLYINTNGEILTASNGKSIYIECKPSTTYTISRTAGARFRITDTSVIPANGVTGSQFVGTDTASKLVITTSANAKYLVVNYYTGNSDTLSEQVIRDSIMIQKGNIENPQYEPYGSNEWYIKKNIGKIVLDGSENWGNDGQSRGYTTNFIDYHPSNAFCNIAVYEPTTTTWTAIGKFGFNASGICWFRLDTTQTDFSNVTNWKNYLSNNNATIVYPLTTSEYIPITGTLAEQLEYVYQLLKSYKGVTNISQVNNDLAFELDVEAVEDME